MVDRVTNNILSRLSKRCLSSKYIGVSYDREREKWASSIVINGKKLHSKRFNSQLLAAKHYQSLFKRYYGESLLDKMLSKKQPIAYPQGFLQVLREKTVHPYLESMRQ